MQFNISGKAREISLSSTPPKPKYDDSTQHNIEQAMFLPSENPVKNLKSTLFFSMFGQHVQPTLLALVIVVCESGFSAFWEKQKEED